MAVYEYLCPKCRKQFELMRPMSEAEKPAKCPKCGSKAQRLISGFGSKTGDSIQSPGEPFRKGIPVKASTTVSKGKSGKTRTTRSKKDKIILLLKQGETSNTIIANKVGCGVGHVGVVKRELLRSHKA